MALPLRVLIIEDAEDAAALLARELARGGYAPACERVDTAPALRAALDREPWDIIFADYTMPQFRGTQALEEVRGRGLDVPFIFVSGTIEEDTAVAAMAAGAQDYIMKDNLRRLVPAVTRELREAAMRRERARGEHELRVLQAVAQTITELSDLLSVLRGVLKQTCAAIGAALAQVWLPSDDGTRIRCSPAWYCALPDAHTFRAAHERRSLAPGQDFPGQVWNAKQIIAADIACRPDFAGGEAAERLGLRAVIGVPVTADDGVIAVLEFYLSQARRPDARELKLLAAVAAQLGSVIRRRRSEERLSYLALHDALTNLPNRALLYERLKQAMYEADRQRRRAAMLVLDVDHFKRINDSLGLEAGDDILRLIAGRISSCVRRGDTVARLGGDEFGVVLSDIAHMDDVTQLARKIIDGVSQPLHMRSQEFFASCSIGVALYPADGSSAEELLKNADAAMYRAKERGRNMYHHYVHEIGLKTQERFTLEAALHRALEREEFALYYQPLVDLRTGAVSDVEALLRWHRPHGQMIGPAQFIPIAEENGLIVPIGEWVLHRACAQCNAWRADGLGPVRVSVNISPRQFHHPHLVATVVKVLRASGLDPELLDLEITEGVLLQNIASTSASLRELSGLGLQLSVDDFGTGYSSLSYLKHLPIDRLKIDQSFVRDVPYDPDDAAIVTAVFTMAHSLGIEAVAEGVETEDQIAFLLERGCDTGQGYAYCRPVPASGIARLVKDGPLRAES